MTGDPTVSESFSSTGLSPSVVPLSRGIRLTIRFVTLRPCGQTGPTTPESSNSLVKRTPEARGQPRSSTTRSWPDPQRGRPLSSSSLVPELPTKARFLIEAITFFRQQLMLYKNMFSPHIDPQTFPSVWLSSFFRLNFTILPKGLLFVLMSFIFSTWVHSLFQLNSSRHSIRSRQSFVRPQS
jgi:hypothetical protein